MRRLSILLVLIWPLVLLAQESEEFAIRHYSVNSGGVYQAGYDQAVWSAVGQSVPGGWSVGDDLVLLTGIFEWRLYHPFQLTPIQELTSRVVAQFVELRWEQIPGANSYLVYRDDTEDVVPVTDNLLGIVGTTAYVDTAAIGMPLKMQFYNVRASAAPLSMARGIYSRTARGTARKSEAQSVARKEAPSRKTVSTPVEKTVSRQESKSPEPIEDNRKSR